MRVWLGTYESAEAAAYAYDYASSNIRKEYAKLNFPELQGGASGTSTGNLQAVTSSVDAKIKVVYKKLNRQRQKKTKAANDSYEYSSNEVYSNVHTKEKEEAMDVEVSTACVSHFSSHIGSPSYSSPCSSYSYTSSIDEDRAMNLSLLLRETDEECSLAMMPCFDPELIWQALTN